MPVRFLIMLLLQVKECINFSCTFKVEFYSIDETCLFSSKLHPDKGSLDVVCSWNLELKLLSVGVLLHLSIYFILCPVAGENLIYALLGKTACFSTDIRTFPDNILWKHNKNKLVEFNGQTQEVFGSFKERISMDWHSAELNISEVRPEDGGLYELETYTNNVLQRAQYNLKVIGKCLDFLIFSQLPQLLLFLLRFFHEKPFVTLELHY